MLLELFLPLLDNRGEEIWQIKIASSIISKFDSDSVFFSKKFDSSLGWDIGKSDIYRQNLSPVNNETSEVEYIAQAYGDSFTQSDHTLVSWHERFYKNYGKGILNFGVGGYGLDQSVLKFEKYHEKYKNKYNTKYVILGLYSQLFRRALSYHTYYYFNNQEFLPTFKPFFIPTREDKFKLINIPCVNSDCLNKEIMNINSQTNQIVYNHDYWYKYNLKKPVFGFPRSLSYIKGIKFYNYIKKVRKYEKPFTFMNDQSIALTKYLIKRFSKMAIEQGVEPLFLLMYGQFEINGQLLDKREDKWLIQFLNENNFKYIDTSNEFIEYHLKNEGFGDLFISDGHYSDKGDSIIANSLNQYFQNYIK